MKAWQIHKQQPIHPHSLQLAELPVPTPKFGQVRLKIHACGVCHTDLHTMEGDIHPPVLPIIPGHQVVGVIDSLGDGVSHLEIGRRVGVPWLHSVCGVCDYCDRHEQNLCPDARFTGFHTNGGYAEYMLARTDFVLPIPASLSDEQAAPLLCAGVVGYRSLIKADLNPGERLGLIGFGGSAHLCIQVALHWGCDVYVFTRSEAHRQHARELGAAWAGSLDDPIDRPLDRAVMFAPAGELVPQVLGKLRPGGTFAINAIHTSPIPEMQYSLIYGERTMRSVANATHQDGLEFMRLAAEIPVLATVTSYPFLNANQALLDLKNSRINGQAVLVISE